ncbi:MAG: alpha/beta hydrolase [Myxococcales bacterium]|nr:alpha/beta hydrolase [Myxococcales bacterium]
MAFLTYDDSGLVPARDQTRLFYGERGRGPDVLLLDGIGCDGWAWTHIQPRLARDHRVIHTQYRGHGRSGSPIDPERTAIGDLAEDALQVMEALRIPHAAILAHSMGTQVALEMYRQQPERIGALVLICGTAGNITQTFHGNDILHRILPALTEHVRRYRPVVQAFWRRLPPRLSYRVATWMGEVDGAALDPDDFRQYVEHLSDIDLDLYLALLREAGTHSAADVLPTIRVPTLVIGAERDTFTPSGVVKSMYERIPDAEYLELKGGSHAAPAEQPERILERLREFLHAVPAQVG